MMDQAERSDGGGWTNRGRMSRRGRGSRWWRRGMLALALPGLAGVAAACTSGSGSATTITLYNGQHQQTTAALVKAFERETGITVQVRNDSETVLVNQVQTEGSASPADVIYTENSLGLELLQEHQLLAPVAPATLAAVPARYNSPTGHWVGVSARVNTMIYNTDHLTTAELPKSVLDLAQPEWKGRIGLAQGEADFYPVVASIERSRGRAAAEAWLAGVKANAGGNVYANNETLVNEVNQGHVEVAMANDYYWYRQEAEVGPSDLHSAVAPFSPDDPGYVVDVSGAGVMASSHAPAAAQRFVAFLVSRQGQEILAHSQSFEYPLGSGVTTAQNLPAFVSLRPAPLTAGELGDGSGAIALLQQVGLA